ncbi:MAG: GNAT family N-acetyltransferase [Candidatus Acidiferrales bacterium]
MTIGIQLKETPAHASPPSSSSGPKHVRVYPGFDALPEGYPGVFDSQASPDFHLTLPWFSNFVATALDPGDAVRLYSVESESQNGNAAVAALLPMRASTSRQPAMEPRTLASLTNYYTCLFGPLLAPGAASAECLHSIASAIASEHPRWDMVRVNPLPHDSASFSEMNAAFKSAGFATQEFFSFGNWFLPVEGRSFEQYMEGRPSVLQNTFRRKAKKLEQTGRARIEIVAQREGLEKAIADYGKVYSASWKVPEPHPEFMPGLIRTCAELGWLRLGLVYMDDLPVATQLWIVHHGVASIYKLAYDEKFAPFSVGTILTARLMQHALDVDRVHEVDYLSGDDDYKKTWMSHRRERWGLMAFNPRTVKGALAMTRHIGGRKLKRAYEKFARRGGPAKDAPAIS